jgi:hypothetical protein
MTEDTIFNIVHNTELQSRSVTEIICIDGRRLTDAIAFMNERFDQRKKGAKAYNAN